MVLKRAFEHPFLERRRHDLSALFPFQILNWRFSGEAETEDSLGCRRRSCLRSFNPFEYASYCNHSW
jgi:hypothetical protein